MKRADGWQIALVCGLMLAGQPYTEGCRIARIGFRRMKASLPKDWTGRKVIRSKWRGNRLEDLATDYRAHSLSDQEIMDRHGVTPHMLRKLATVHGWPSRPRKKWGTLSSWCPERRKLYFKLRIHLGISEARKAAWAADIPSAGTLERPFPASTAVVDGREPSSVPQLAAASNSGGGE